MPPAALPLHPTEWIARIIDGLKHALAAWVAKNPASLPLILLLWRRLGGMVRRLAAIAADPAGRPHRPPRKTTETAERPERKPYQYLPGGQAWLIRLVREAAPYGSQLRHLLAQPEMAAFLAAAPRAGRVLRPLCRMLGVRPLPPPLRPAPRTSPAARRPARRRRGPPAPPRRPTPPPAAKIPRRACGPPDERP